MHDTNGAICPKDFSKTVMKIFCWVSWYNCAALYIDYTREEI